MKKIIYTLLLLITISGDLVYHAYTLSFEHDNIELINDSIGENESEESKEIEEDTSVIPSSHFQFNLSFNNKIQKSSKSLIINDEQFSQVATPPPDYV